MTSHVPIPEKFKDLNDKIKEKKKPQALPKKVAPKPASPSMMSPAEKFSFTQLFQILSKPKLRRVIYGITNRIHDPVLLQINDFIIDHSSISLKEKNLLFHSLQLLVGSGVKFTKSLKMLSERTQNIRLSRILDTVVYDMENQGLSFSAALQKYPVFSNSEIKMIYSGEITGNIEDSLQTIATQLQKSIELQIQVKNALTYPLVVFFAIFLAGVVVVMFIVPKFIGLFSEFGSSLPWSTKLLMQTSDFFIHFWWLIFMALIGAVFAFKKWTTSPDGKITWDRFLLKIPIFAPIINNIQTVRITNNFSCLMQSGIPVSKALRILSEIIPNAAITESIENIEINVREGMAIHKSFRQETILDPVISEIIDVGEQTGRIPEVLGKLGSQYELEVESQLKNLTTLIEPLVIIVVGAAVVFMAMAIMTPIFQMQELFTTG